MAPARTESPRPYRLAEVNAGITLTYGRQVDGGEGKGERLCFFSSGLRDYFWIPVGSSADHRIENN